jgi:hypothetical protein
MQGVKVAKSSLKKVKKLSSLQSRNTLMILNFIMSLPKHIVVDLIFFKKVVYRLKLVKLNLKFQFIEKILLTISILGIHCMVFFPGSKFHK